MYLDNMNLGFIGTGKMGESLIRGLVDAKAIAGSNIYASDVYEVTLNKIHKELGINISTENQDVIANSDAIILAVKPQIIKNVLRNIREHVTNDKLIISIAAGVTTDAIENELNGSTRVVRIMPNIAATVGEAASAVSSGENASIDDVEMALEIFGHVGTATLVAEHLMDAVTGLSGSGPAYIFPVIEAMADGAVYEGLDRQSALTLAAQTVLGAAKMVLETKKHPGVLKDMVTSPAGTTIRGVHTLEESGVRSAFMNAVIESSKRSKELGN